MPHNDTHTNMQPKDIVAELDKHIIGQHNAKRAVAIALRNRWRRRQLADPMRTEISPKNILMIGPTGSGKTEIARRLASLAQAPFIKVDATKFTETGYVGADTQSIVRELTEAAITLTREIALNKVSQQAHDLAVKKVLQAFVETKWQARSRDEDTTLPTNSLDEQSSHLSEEEKSRLEKQMVQWHKKEKAALMAHYLQPLLDGELDDEVIDITLTEPNVGVEVIAPFHPNVDELTNQFQHIFQSLSQSKKRQKRITVSTALGKIKEEEAEKLLNEEDMHRNAITLAEQEGIVFIDEIDKLIRTGHQSQGEISREGVQRDLLPIIEGCAVSTKYGLVRTDHILFIAAGAFHWAKPADLAPELQGRLPIRVELSALSAEDFFNILSETDFSLVKQYTALLGTEGILLHFHTDALRKIAEVAFQVNARTENIGARRLSTVMEKLLEEIAFCAPDIAEKNIDIDVNYVQSRLSDLVKDEDLSRYIL